MECTEGMEIMETKINWSIHAEFVIIFITLLSGYFMIDSKIERQSERTDKLYEMFIDLIKDKK
jgi:hypothetical protein